MLQHLGIQNVLRMQKVYHIPGGLWAESERVGVGGWLMGDGSVVAGRTAMERRPYRREKNQSPEVMP